MATDVEQLVVQLEARIDAFEKNMAKAAKSADGAFAGIEKRSKQMAGNLQTNIEKASAGIVTSLASIGGASTGLGLASAVTAAVAVNRELVQMGALAKRVQESTDRIQELRFAATSKGVSGADFTSGLDNLARILNDAIRQETDFGRLFAANNMALKDREGRVVSVNEALARAAELIKNARSEQDKIKIAEMFGLTKDWVRALEGGARAFNATAAEARNAGVVIDNSIIRQAQAFDAEWTAATAKWSMQLKAGAAAVLPDLQNLANKALGIVETLQSFASNSVIAGKLDQGLQLSAKELRDAIALARSKGSPVDPSWITDLQRLTEAEAELARERARGAALGGLPGESGPTKLTVIPAPKGDEDAFARAQDAAQKRIAMLNADTAAVGLNEAARERLRMVAELEEAAMRANREAGMQNVAVTESQREAIDRLAGTMEAAAMRQQQARAQFEGWNSAIQFGGQQTIGVIEQILDKSASGAEIVNNLAKSLRNALLQAALLGQGPLAGLMGTASPVSGGTGGLLGLLFGGLGALGGGGMGVLGGIGGGLGGLYADGGYTGPGGRNEPAGTVHRGEYVFDKRAVDRIGVPALNRARSGGGLNGSGGGAGGGQPVVINNSYDFRGAEPGSEARMRAYVDESSRMAVQEAVREVQRTVSNNPAYLRQRG